MIKIKAQLNKKLFSSVNYYFIFIDLRLFFIIGLLELVHIILSFFSCLLVTLHCPHFLLHYT